VNQVLRKAGGDKGSAPYVWKLTNKKKRLRSLAHHSNMFA
jgi:hypothetical protein